MSTRYRADEYAEIAKGLKELEAAKLERINTPTIEDAKPVEAPADIDWTGVYGYHPCGYKTGDKVKMDGITYTVVSSLHG